MKRLHSAFDKLFTDVKHLWLPGTVALLWLIAGNYFFNTPCPIAIIFHFPCPGCGMTRAFIAVLHCRIYQAFEYNAMIFAWIPLVIYLGIFRYFIQKEPPLFLPVCIGIGLLTICYYAFRLTSGNAFALL